MFWKVFGVVVAVFTVFVLGIFLLAVAGVTAAGAAVVSAVDQLEIQTVQVTDDQGHTETYKLSELISESGRVEVTGENGEQVTIDLSVPQITVQESGGDAARVIIGDGPTVELKSDGANVQVDGLDFDGRFVARPSSASSAAYLTWCSGAWLSASSCW